MYFVESHQPTTLTAAKGRSRLTTLLKAGASLVALDARNGDELWRQTVDLKRIEHHLFLCHSQGNLLAIGTRNQRDKSGGDNVWYDVLCFDATTGKQSWANTQNQGQRSGGSHGEQDHHPVVVKGTVYVEPFAYRIATGKRVSDWQLKRNGHGCGTMSASANTFFFRAANPTMCDISTGTLHRVTTVSRPGCWINMIPAGGVLLIPEASSGCTCNFSIQCSMAFWPTEVGSRSK